MKILIFVIMVFPAFVWAHYSYEEIKKRNPVKTHKIPFWYPEPGMKIEFCGKLVNLVLCI